MKQFRIKFTLTDGRKIYATTAGRFQLFEAGELETPAVRNMINGSAYTQDLSMLFSLASGSQSDHVRIASAKLEPEGSAVDKSAFVLGGKKALELKD